MGRAPCCSKVGLHRGPWSAKEDALLSKYIEANGEGNWRSLPRKAGLLRCGKSCRLRWMNYLRPDIKRGNISPEEEDLIIRLHNLLGNRWSLIAGRLPGRTDNEIKNYWNTHISKKLKSQTSPLNFHKSATKKCEAKRSTKNGKKERRNLAEENEERSTKTIVFLPKPTRLASFKTTKQYSTMESSDDGSIDKCQGPVSGAHGEAIEEVAHLLPWHDHNDQYEYNQLLNADFFLQSEFTMNNNMLDKLYEEYLELIKAQEGQVQESSLEESLWD